MCSEPPQATPFPEHLNMSCLHLLPLDIHVNPRCAWKIHRFVVSFLQEFQTGSEHHRQVNPLLHKHLWFSSEQERLWKKAETFSALWVVSQRFTSEAAHNTSWQPHTWQHQAKWHLPQTYYSRTRAPMRGQALLYCFISTIRRSTWFRSTSISSAYCPYPP